MKDYLDGLLKGPSGLTNAVSRLGPILGHEKTAKLNPFAVFSSDQPSWSATPDQFGESLN